MERTVLVPGDPSAVGAARRFCRGVCHDAGVDGDLCDSAVLLTSELVTNAIIHGRSDARLHVVADPGRVLVEVTDDNSRLPAVQDRDDDALDGRGVQMVDLVAADWGVREEPIGKTVWFTVSA